MKLNLPKEWFERNIPPEEEEDCTAGNPLPLEQPEDNEDSDAVS